MLTLGSASFVLDIAPLGEDGLTAYAQKLFEEYAANLDNRLRLSDYEVHVEVEEGSIRGKGWVVAAAAVLYSAIGGYGDFRSGVRQLSEDLAWVQGAFIRSASKCGGFPGRASQVRQRGILKEVEALFSKVERRELDPVMAAQQAIALFAEEQEVPPDLQRKINEAMGCTVLDPLQLTLPDQAGPTPSLPAPPHELPKRARFPPPPVDIRRYRVEIWRDSKNGPQRVRVLPT